ncbi:MAG: chemotaxis protein CheX [Legionella sp.]|nr:chemotaxis protein CheX [Legionella sp.]
MANRAILEEWIQAQAEAVADFSQEILGVPGSIHVAPIEWMDKELCLSLMGASLELSNNEQLIKILLLSNEEVLTKIAKLMLMSTPGELLSQADMMDAIKEVVNIISGGIKSRMNERMGGGILLGLPYFSQKNLISQEADVLIGKVSVANMPIYLAVSIK